MSLDHNENLDELCARMGVEIHDRSLLVQALTHRSYGNQRETGDYERLEFLGDAVLELAISRVLWDAFPDMDAGELTKFRASIVNKRSLAGLARRLNIGPFIRLSRGEAHTSGREKNSILADVYEAVLGAMFLDRGFEVAAEFVRVQFDAVVQGETRSYKMIDYKTRLQEITQAESGVAPEYQVVEEIGPDHDKRFIVELLVLGEVVSLGEGKTKKEAEQQAAKSALAKHAAAASGEGASR
ncbi:ribonuclease III [bacterium]|nr:ribonuclease III [bacterium]